DVSRSHRLLLLLALPQSHQPRWRIRGVQLATSRRRGAIRSASSRRSGASGALPADRIRQLHAVLRRSVGPHQPRDCEVVARRLAIPDAPIRPARDLQPRRRARLLDRFYAQVLAPPAPSHRLDDLAARVIEGRPLRLVELDAKPSLVDRSMVEAAQG